MVTSGFFSPFSMGVDVKLSKHLPSYIKAWLDLANSELSKNEHALSTLLNIH